MNYKEFYNVLLNVYGKEQIELNAPMSEHIYFKVGGPADILVNPRNVDQVIQTIKLCKENNVPYLILGNGSNMLVKDGGIRGVVIKLSALDKIEVKNNEITAQCGALLCDVSKKALENNLTGFEFACGIPGSVGGAVFMNAGAYDGEISYVVKDVQAIDDNGHIINIGSEKLELGYRTSIIMKKGYVVVSATFSLHKGEHKSIEDKINELTRKRKEKQPLEYPSAGSTFKRPVGHYTGKLIQEAGLKGFSIGGAAVSTKHCGFVINKGGATAKDILDVIDHIQKTIKSRFGVDLKTEVRIIGED